MSRTLCHICNGAFSAFVSNKHESSITAFVRTEDLFDVRQIEDDARDNTVLIALFVPYYGKYI